MKATFPQPQLSLQVFFEAVYAPLQLRNRKVEYAEVFRGSIRWLGSLLGREPQIGDLTRETMSDFLARLAAIGLGPSRQKQVRKHLWRLWRYAHALGYAASPPPALSRPQPKLSEQNGRARVWVQGRWIHLGRAGTPEAQARYLDALSGRPTEDHLPLPPAAVPPSPAWASDVPPVESLLAFYRGQFRREASRVVTRKQVAVYDQAINHFHQFAGGHVPLAAATPELMAAFAAWLGAQSLSSSTRRGLLGGLRRILRAHAPELWPLESGGVDPKRPIGEAEALRCQQMPRRRHRPEPIVGEPGTVVHFFTSVYAPEVLARCTVGSRSEHERTLRQLRHCYGRDLRLEELGRDVVTRFTAWLFEAGKKPQTVRNERGRFLAVWRYAAELDRAPTPPKFRRLKIPRESPDAWSLDEVGRLIDAAGRLERKPIAGIPVGPYLRAMLLVCWYSALRRSSLVRIRMCDVDLEGARLYVPADRIKNCCGQGFRLGPDAIAAVRTIWDSGRELLFPPPADMTLLNRLFAMALRTADVAQRRRLNNSHFHKLRRSVATHTASRAGLAAATALLGHSTAELLKRYIDPSYMTGTDATAWLPPIGQREERFSGQDKS